MSGQMGKQPNMIFDESELSSDKDESEPLNDTSKNDRSMMSGF